MPPTSKVAPKPLRIQSHYHAAGHQSRYQAAPGLIAGDYKINPAMVQ